MAWMPFHLLVPSQYFQNAVELVEASGERSTLSHRFSLLPYDITALPGFAVTRN